MKFVFQVIAVATLAVFLMTSTVSAVGYERYYPENYRGARYGPAPKASPHLWESVKEASFIEKVPIVIEGAAMVVRDLLSQFGLTESKAP